MLLSAFGEISENSEAPSGFRRSFRKTPKPRPAAGRRFVKLQCPVRRAETALSNCNAISGGRKTLCQTAMSFPAAGKRIVKLQCHFRWPENALSNLQCHFRRPEDALSNCNASQKSQDGPSGKRKVPANHFDGTLELLKWLRNKIMTNELNSDAAKVTGMQGVHNPFFWVFFQTPSPH
jgi:hypothetical protein